MKLLCFLTSVFAASPTAVPTGKISSTTKPSSAPSSVLSAAPSLVLSLPLCYDFIQNVYPGWTLKLISPPPSSSPSVSPTLLPTFSPTTQLVVWYSVANTVLSEDIIDVAGKLLTFESYANALYACQVVFPVCVGISYNPLTSFTINKSVKPIKLKNGQAWVLELGTNSPPSTSPTSILTSAPSSKPTTILTLTPSSNPTSVSTFAPSSNPTSFPTFEPSSNPTTIPSFAPSSNPTSVPTFAPSSSPTSSKPTIIPPSQTPNFITNCCIRLGFSYELQHE
jgi:hypothetical protein